MTFLKTTFAALVATSYAGFAQAQDSGVYVNLDVNAVGVDDFEGYSLGGKFGYNFNEYFGVEGEASFGISDDKEGGIEVGVDTAFGGYAVARYPVAPNFEVFGRVGYHTTEVDINFDRGLVGAVRSIDGVAIGGGAQYFVSQNDGLRLEYTFRDLDSSFGSADVYSISYVRKF